MIPFKKDKGVYFSRLLCLFYILQLSTTNYGVDLMNILNEAEEISSQIIFWRRQLHQIPEIGLVLPQTAAFVKKCLDNMSISYQTYDKHSGIVAVLGKATGRTIGIRADMDGLRIQEDSDFDYKSGNKNMHACGHDAHTAFFWEQLLY